MCYTLLCFFSIEHIKITFLIGLSQNIKKALQLKKTPLNVDFIKFFKTLREINFSGPMTLEMWAQNYEDPYKAAKDALSFIKDKYERSSQ